VGHVREDLQDLPVKFWPVFFYLVIYKPHAKPLEVLRILHAARDIATILEAPTTIDRSRLRPPGAETGRARYLRDGITGSRMCDGRAAS
jgi:hypothetical protein